MNGHLGYDCNQIGSKVHYEIFVCTKKRLEKQRPGYSRDRIIKEGLYFHSVILLFITWKLNACILSIGKPNKISELNSIRSWCLFICPFKLGVLIPRPSRSTGQDPWPIDPWGRPFIIYCPSLEFQRCKTRLLL